MSFMIKRIFMCLLFIFLILTPKYCFAYTNILSLSNAYKFLRFSNKTDASDITNFVKILKKMPFKKLSILISHLPRKERAQSIIALALEKKLILEADALHALRQLKELEKRANFLEAKGATDNMRKLDDYHQVLLKKIAEGEKFSHNLIPKQVQQLKNGGLAGTRHYKSGILFDNQGFPIFESHFSTHLPPSMYKLSDVDQFNYAIHQLATKIKQDPEFAKHFSLENQERILRGYKPNGYTWHHSQKDGILELVDTIKHQQTSHTGGRAIWGGGSTYR